MLTTNFLPRHESSLHTSAVCWGKSNWQIGRPQCINTLRPRQNGRRFADDVFKGIFLNENVWISINISLKFVPKGPINNIPALVQIMAWRRPGDKPLSEPVMVRLLTHIWVNVLIVWMCYIICKTLSLYMYHCLDHFIMNSLFWMTLKS